MRLIFIFLLCTSIIVHISVAVEIWEFGHHVEGDEVIEHHKDSMGIFERTKHVQLHVPTCSRLTYVKVMIDNLVSSPQVLFDKHVNVVTISYGMFQNSWSNYHVVVKALSDGCKKDEKETKQEREKREQEERQKRELEKGYRFIPSVGSYYKVSRKARTWQEAAAVCRADGAHLAVINSQQESRQLKNILTSIKDVPFSVNNDYLLIGFTAETISGTRIFKTIFDQTLEEAGFSTWHPGEPNNYEDNENCGSITRGGKLNDVPCSFRFAFICEKEDTYRL